MDDDSALPAVVHQLAEQGMTGMDTFATLARLKYRQKKGW